KLRSAPEHSCICGRDYSIPRCRHHSDHGHRNAAPHGWANVFALRRLHSHRLAHGEESPASIPAGEFDARVDFKMPGRHSREVAPLKLWVSHAILTHEWSSPP